MKAIKGLVLFIVLAVAISSCFDPPEFAIEPVISLEDMYMNAVSTPGVRDSLVIEIAFRDGDGDLGLENTIDDNPSHFISPFSDFIYYIDNNGERLPIGTREILSRNNRGAIPHPLLDLQGKTGKLMTKRTVDRFFPSLDRWFFGSCNYVIDTVFVDDSDNVVDPQTAQVIDSGSTPTIAKVLVVADTFYINQNPERNNIRVQFYEQDLNGGGTFNPIVFGSECLPYFDGRFPVLSRKKAGTPVEGILRYSLKSSDLRDRLRFSFFKLKITIQDRAGHNSNEIETKVVSLDKLVR